MASKKSYDERIEEIKKKQEQLKAQEKALKKKQSAAERKKRNHIISSVGGGVEKVLKEALGEEDGFLREEDTSAIIEFLRMQEKNGKFFSNAILKGREVNAEKSTSEEGGDVNEAKA